MTEYRKPFTAHVTRDYISWWIKIRDTDGLTVKSTSCLFGWTAHLWAKRVLHRCERLIKIDEQVL